MVNGRRQGKSIEMKVQFKEVSKQFGKLMALDSVNFTIKPGEFVFLTGRSGAGKTTALRLITDYYRADKGEILLDNQRLSQLKTKQRLSKRRRIGMVFQEFKLIPQMTVAENVMVAVALRGAAKKKRHQEVEQALRLVNLEDKMAVFPAQLSGGELQQVCLARALAMKPDLLLADEPTGNLDPASSWELMNLLIKVNKQGKTVIMATHNVDIVNSFATRVITLEKGKIIGDKKKGKYQ